MYNCIILVYKGLLKNDQIFYSVGNVCRPLYLIYVVLIFFSDNSLGAFHDGSGNVCDQDGSIDIMNPSIAADMTLTFSTCSIEYFKKTLMGEDDIG